MMVAWVVCVTLWFQLADAEPFNQPLVEHQFSPCRARKLAQKYGGPGRF